MNNSINFTGEIQTASYLKGQIKRKELDKIKSFAQQTNSDVFIYRRLETENSVVFDTVVAKNARPIYFREFDIKDDSRSYISERPTGILA